MIGSASLLVDAVVTLVALVAGYLAGSIPISQSIARTAGVDVPRDGGQNPRSANAWKLAGPGWGLLALTGDIAKGVLPVAIGAVTWSWSVGWLAGVGALVGACWPLFGRPGGGRGVAVLAGAAVALSPAAGVLGLLLALGVALVARVIGRNGRVVAIAAGVGTYPFLFLAAEADPWRLAGLMVLYLVAALRLATAPR